tara:strand:- start:2125 stop:3882 length:1758 start_codon:yes stop_codon:yes gene_type:complete
LYSFDLKTYLKKFKEIKNIENEDQISIAILSSSTINQFEMFLSVELFNHSIYSKFYIPGFNQFEIEIFDEKSKLYSSKPQMIFFLLPIEDLVGRLTFKSENNSILKRFDEFYLKLIKYIEQLSQKTNADIIFSNFLYPQYICQPIADFQSKNGVLETINNLNHNIKDLTNEYKNFHIFNFFGASNDFGLINVYENKMYYFASIRFKVDFLSYSAFKLGQQIKSMIKTRKKCLILDLDNTLWGGIIGEDGLSGIKLGNNYPGNVYRDIQLIIKEILSSGVLLAINSKNNYSDVKQVFSDHPNMKLKLEDFSIIKANWKSKYENMIEISKELNIGLDSLVFIDDNPIEIGEINHLLPEVTTVQFEKDNPLYNLETMQNLDFFYSIFLTSEDLLKTQQYKEQVKRKNLEKNFSSIDKYYQSLEIVISVLKINEFFVPRISQLTQKTNQFNLTTKRYSENQIRRMMDDDRILIYCLNVRDKVGDYGNVGVFIGKLKENTLTIDTFLLSCRVIGRGIEKAFLHFILEEINNEDVKLVYGSYIKTQKNSLVKNFYDNVKFNKISENRWEVSTPFSIDLPSWITINNDIPKM